MDEKVPKVGEFWRHRNGNLYMVTLLTNLQSERPHSYPITVVYVGSNHYVWSRPLWDWHRSMTYCPEVKTWPSNALNVQDQAHL